MVYDSLFSAAKNAATCYSGSLLLSKLSMCLLGIYIYSGRTRAHPRVFLGSPCTSPSIAWGTRVRLRVPWYIPEYSRGYLGTYPSSPAGTRVHTRVHLEVPEYNSHVPGTWVS